MHIKINESNPIYDILPYIPHFEEAKQIGRDEHKLSFLNRNQEAMTNCNFDINIIMKENEHTAPWITGRTIICIKMTQYAKKDTPRNILKNI